jgi:hypothetical protein
MNVVEIALDEYRVSHAGGKPLKIVITPHAVLALGADADFKLSSFGGIEVQVTSFDGSEAVEAGKGTRIGLFMRDNGIQQHVAAVDLR